MADDTQQPPCDGDVTADADERVDFVKGLCCRQVIESYKLFRCMADVRRRMSGDMLCEYIFALFLVVHRIRRWRVLVPVMVLFYVQTY